MKKAIVLACVLSAVTLAPRVGAQSVFRSTQSANLPTAAMLAGGNWLFEVSHRFGPISTGAKGLWGVDGPARLRLGLAFAAHDRLMLGLLRSNLEDNVELNAKFRGFSATPGGVPVEVGAQGGIAWNTEATVFAGATDNEMQAYVQVLANVLVADRIALGVVPSFVRNPRILDVDAESAFMLGVQGQVYTNGGLSFLGEWNFSAERPSFEHDGGTFGIELRTRGHFFKIVVTNQSRLNPTQFLGGTDLDFDPDNLMLGFNLTRLLPF